MTMRLSCLIIFLSMLTYNILDKSHALQKYSEEIVLSDEWQVVGPNQTVPQGAHISINLKTGEKLAKKLEQYTAPNNALIPSGGVIDQKPNNLDDDKVGKKRVGVDISLIDAMSAKETAPLQDFNKTKLEELMVDFAKLSVMFESDVQKIRRSLNHYKTALSVAKDVKERQAYTLKFLEAMNDLLEDGDNAQNFVDMDGLTYIVEILNSSSDEPILQKASSVIGVASQNIKKVQRAVLGAGILPLLMHLLSTDSLPDITKNNVEKGLDNVVEKAIFEGSNKNLDQKTISLPTKKTVLFALSALLRGFPPAQAQFFNQYSGLGALKQFAGQSFELANDEFSQKLVAKSVALIDDLMLEAENFKEYARPGDIDYEENLIAYKSLDLKEILRNGKWCYVYPIIIPHLSLLPEIEIIVGSWRNLMPVCGAEFNLLSPTLDKLSEKLESQNTNDDYVAILSRLIEDSKRLARLENVPNSAN